MRLAPKIPSIAAALLGFAAAQTSAFEVASIKPDEAGGNYIEAARGSLTAHSATPATCVQWAYGVQASQVVGANSAVSALLESERYTIAAKAGGPAADSELRTMLQTLLAERFKLALHRESREIHSFALVLEKSGPKFHQSEGDGESRQQTASKLVRRWTHTTIAQLASSLGDAMQAPVEDRTGLAGQYDFALDLTPYLTAGERPDISGMMVTAVKEQLGLKLEPRRASVDVLIIDHLEKPAAN